MGRITVIAAAALLLAAPGAAGAAVRHRIDLASGSLDGHAVLGSTLPQVVAAAPPRLRGRRCAPAAPDRLG